MATVSQFAAPRDGEAMKPLRRASQELTKVATVSQFAAPRDGEASCCFICV